MADVFGRATEFGAAISSDGTRVTFDDFQVGFLIQQLQLVYRQNVTRIFELSSNRQYYVIGRPQGNMTMARVVGPQGVTSTFVNKFGDACNANNNTVHLSAVAGCKPAGNNTTAKGVQYTAGNVILEQMTMGVVAENMLINESFQLMFVGLTSGV